VHLPTWRKCPRGIDVAERDGEGKAPDAHSDTHDVFISYASPTVPSPRPFVRLWSKPA
jgi:hypothetical protein